jgi:predicted DNA-binding transcriptional regulator AlpA
VKANELLRDLDSAVASAEPDQLRGLVVALAAVTNSRRGPGSWKPPRARWAPAQTADRLLTAKEAAAIAAVSMQFLYEHSHQLPFAKRLGDKVVRFSEKGLRQWIENRKA